MIFRFGGQSELRGKPRCSMPSPVPISMWVISQGVTVDQKVGEVKGAPNCSVVDLPGIYSIRPYSQEEIVTRDFVLGGKPDGIINIVDATNIERNLYLTLQLLELRIPTVVALNMMDELTGNGGSVDIQKCLRPWAFLWCPSVQPRTRASRS